MLREPGCGAADWMPTWAARFTGSTNRASARCRRPDAPHRSAARRRAAADGSPLPQGVAPARSTDASTWRICPSARASAPWLASPWRPMPSARGDHRNFLLGSAAGSTEQEAECEPDLGSLAQCRFRRREVLELTVSIVGRGGLHRCRAHSHCQASATDQRAVGLSAQAKQCGTSMQTTSEARRAFTKFTGLCPYARRTASFRFLTRPNCSAERRLSLQWDLLRHSLSRREIRRQRLHQAMRCSTGQRHPGASAASRARAAHRTSARTHG
jgi:hypothetical protein